MGIIKFLLKFILGIIITVVVLAGITVGVAYATLYSKMDTAAYEEVEPIDNPKQYLYDKIYTTLSNYSTDTSEDPMNFYFTDKELNGMVKGYIDTLDMSSVSDYLSINGAWLEFDGAEFTIKASANTKKYVKFHTSIDITFDFNYESDTQEYVLSVKKAKIGNISAMKYIGKIESYTNEGDLGKYYHKDEHAFRISKEELQNELVNNSSEESVTEAIDFIFENDLIDVKVEQGFGLVFNLGTVRNHNTISPETTLEELAKDAQTVSVMQQVAAEFILRRIADENASMNLNEIQFNTILASQMDPSNLEKEFELGGYTYKFIIQSAYMHFTENPSMNIAFSFADISFALKLNIQFSNEVYQDEKSLKIAITDGNMGTLNLTTENIADLLSKMQLNSGFISQDAENLYISYKGLEEEIFSNTLSISRIDYEDLCLKIYGEPKGEFKLTYDAAILSLRNNLSLMSGLDTPVQDKVDQVVASFTDSSVDTSEAIQELLEVVDELDDAEKEELYQKFIDNAGNIEDLFKHLGD